MQARDGQELNFRKRKIAVIERFLECREKYTPREWGMLQLYYVCGLTQDEIAGIFQVTRGRISQCLREIRRKALS
jgi:RNA polymerase sigma factor (sigma-70 family)